MQKKLIYFLFFICLIIVIGILCIERRHIQERWYLWKLTAGDKEESVFAAQKLCALNSLKAVPLLVEKMGEEQDLTRQMCYILAISTFDGDVVPILSDCIKKHGNDFKYRYGVISVLGHMGPKGGDGVNILISILQCRSYSDTHYAAIQALGRIGPPAREAVEYIEPYLTHQSEAYRAAARRAILKIGKK